MNQFEPIPFVDLWWQNQQVLPEVTAAFSDIIETSSFILRDYLSDFESAFSAYIGTKYAVGVGNGTDALVIALRSLGVGLGDEVITVPNSFFATAEAIAQVGATPIFVDVNPETFTMDLALLGESIRPSTKAVIPVHLYGRPVDMKSLSQIAKDRNVAVIEDSAQAHGATVDSIRVGGIGDIGCFSFYPTKNLGGFGDGGAIVTNDTHLANQALRFRDHGGLIRDEHMFVAYNSRLDAMQAAVLTLKLRFLDSWNERRRNIADCYRRTLERLELSEIVHAPGGVGDDGHVYHLFVVRVPGYQRKAIVEGLSKRGVGTMITYPVPIHLTPAFGHLGHTRGSFPVSEKLSQEILSLPIHPGMSERDVVEVCHRLRDTLLELGG